MPNTVSRAGSSPRDHKRIAILYLISVSFFFLVGGLLAMTLRFELLTPGADLMALDTYNKVFSMHGIVMVFFVLIPAIPAILGNFVLPLMLGARDLAFPKINLLSWYCFIIGGMLLLYTVLAGGVDTGWTFTTPLSTRFVNTNVISAGLAAFVAGFSSILTGLNFIVTIHRMRAPGLTWFRLPLFVWAQYAASIIMSSVRLSSPSPSSSSPSSASSASASSTPPKAAIRSSSSISSGSTPTPPSTSCCFPAWPSSRRSSPASPASASSDTPP